MIYYFKTKKMGIMVGLPTSGGTEKDLQLNFGLTVNDQVEMLAPFLPAEWFLQSGIQLTWPHAGTDWAYMLAEVQECFINIAREIAKRELLLIVTPYPEEVRKQIIGTVNMDNVRFLKCDTNDTLGARSWSNYFDGYRWSKFAGILLLMVGEKSLRLV